MHSREHEKHGITVFGEGFGTERRCDWDPAKAERVCMDSPLEEAGFELVWGFSCQVVFWFKPRFLFGAGKPFFVPSLAIRFAERAEGVKGAKR